MSSHSSGAFPTQPVKVIDLEELRERTGGDESLVLELLEEFLLRGVEMTALEAAAEANDRPEIGRLAHRLKGSLLALAAGPAARAASEVEHLASASPDVSAEVLATAVTELTLRCGQAREAMQAVMDGVFPLTGTGGI